MHPSLAIVLTLELQLSIFLGSMGIMEGRDPQHIRARFEDIYQPALLANWKIWPAAQVRCFARFFFPFLGTVEPRHHSLSIFVSCL